jgi:hypothetical protein
MSAVMHMRGGPKLLICWFQESQLFSRSFHGVSRGGQEVTGRIETITDSQ